MQDFENTAKKYSEAFLTQPAFSFHKTISETFPQHLTNFLTKNITFIFFFSVLVENLRVKVRDYVRKVNTVKNRYYEIFKTLTVSARN